MRLWCAQQYKLACKASEIIAECPISDEVRHTAAMLEVPVPVSEWHISSYLIAKHQVYWLYRAKSMHLYPFSHITSMGLSLAVCKVEQTNYHT